MVVELHGYGLNYLKIYNSQSLLSSFIYANNMRIGCNSLERLDTEQQTGKRQLNSLLKF